MKMSLIVDGARFPLRLPHEAADHALCSGTCPSCGVTGFGVQGAGRRPSADDRAWEADGYCARCKKAVGLIRVEPNTLFGVREDEAVLSGRCRVY
jgi:hypothetical protein